MHLSSNWSALPRGIEFLAMPWELRNSKHCRPRHSEPRPTIELMRSIDINELRRVIPRYFNTINEPNVSLKYLDIARLRLSPPTSRSLTISGAYNASYRVDTNLFRPSSAASQISASQCRPSPNGHAAKRTNASVAKAKEKGTARTIFPSSALRTSSLASDAKIARYPSN